jgi:hypothetical protein
MAEFYLEVMYPTALEVGEKCKRADKIGRLSAATSSMVPDRSGLPWKAGLERPASPSGSTIRSWQALFLLLPPLLVFLFFSLELLLLR